MIIYKVTLFSYGNARSVICQGFDVVSAIQSNGLPVNEIVRVELVGSANEENLTIS